MHLYVLQILYIVYHSPEKLVAEGIPGVQEQPVVRPRCSWRGELQVPGVVALREEGKSRSQAHNLQGSDKGKGSGRLLLLRHVWPGAGNDVGLPLSITGCLTDKGCPD